MKKAMVAFVCAFSIAMAPTLLLAQGFSGLSSAVSCPLISKNENVYGPSLYIGYLTDRKGASFGLGAQGPGINGIFAMNHTYPVRGIWLEASQAFPLRERIGAFISGSWLFPTKTSSEETYDFGIPGGRSWTAKPQWWSLTANAVYGFTESFSLIAGVRYDSFMTNFTDPENAQIVASNPNDRADITIHSIIPLVGVATDIGTDSRKLTLGMMGFPTLPGSIKYKQTEGNVAGGPGRYEASGSFKSGYFLEVFGEFGTRSPSLELAIFGKFSTVYGKANMDVDSNDAVFGPLNDTFTFAFDRTAWIIGGKLSAAFSSPF